jgi:hypothetical protein
LLLLHGGFVILRRRPIATLFFLWRRQIPELVALNVPIMACHKVHQLLGHRCRWSSGGVQQGLTSSSSGRCLVVVHVGEEHARHNLPSDAVTFEESANGAKQLLRSTQVHHGGVFGVEEHVRECLVQQRLFVVARARGIGQLGRVEQTQLLGAGAEDGLLQGVLPPMSGANALYRVPTPVCAEPGHRGGVVGDQGADNADVVRLRRRGDTLLSECFKSGIK